MAVGLIIQFSGVDAAKAPGGAGDAWTWTALEADTKLIVSFAIGDRDSDCAKRFMGDVAARLANRVQLTSDGHRAYLDAVEDTFGADVDYAQLVKLFGASPDRAAGLTEKLMDWENIIAIMDSEEKNALTRKRAAMLDKMPYSN